MKIRHLLACTAFTPLLVMLLPTVTVHAAAIDADIFATYSVNDSATELNMSVCGALKESDGCYFSQKLGPFGRIGSMLESAPVVNPHLVTRNIYILDVASGASANGVTLQVYERQDLITASRDSVTVTLIKTISLPLIGGTGVTAQLAGNSQYLFAGTNQSLVATQITTSGWAISEFGAGSPSAPVAAITANSRGVITVTFGPPNPSFYVFSAGRGDEDGGGEEFMVGTQNGVAPLVP